MYAVEAKLDIAQLQDTGFIAKASATYSFAITRLRAIKGVGMREFDVFVVVFKLTE